MMKILVTGSCGFVFSNFIIYALQHTNWDLVSIDKLDYAGSITNLPSSDTGPGLVKRHRFYLGDVADYHFTRKIFELEKPDIVIHGAASSHVDNSIKDSNDFIHNNVVGTHSMLDACVKSYMPKMFINFSTDEVYSQIAEGSFTEKDGLFPRNPYSASKASADLMGQAYFTTHDVPVITTRTCNIFGPRQNPEKLIPKVITNIISRKNVPVYGKGNQVREWIYVKDVFNALNFLINCGAPGEIYNISTNSEKTNLEVISGIIDYLGEGSDLIQHVEDRKAHDFRYSVDASKLIGLGWKPSYSFNDALKHTVGWYKHNSGFWRK